MQDLGNEVPLRLSTAEGSDIDVTAVLDEAGQAWLKSAMAGRAAVEVQLRPSEDDDVRAHAVQPQVGSRVGPVHGARRWRGVRGCRRHPPGSRPERLRHLQ